MVRVRKDVAMKLLENELRKHLVDCYGDFEYGYLYLRMYKYQLDSGKYDGDDVYFNPIAIVARDVTGRQTIVLDEDDQDYPEMEKLYDALVYDISENKFPSGYKGYAFLEILDKETGRALVRYKE